jgi:predicted proteasome-type protease
MANLIIAYDFEYITHHVPDVRNMVEYLEEHIYRALTQVEWRVQLKEYFEDLRNISVPNSEDYQVFDASITLLEDVREIYQKDRTVEER